MIDETADVAVIGSGFGGSLAALVLSRLGLRVILVDRAAHPRFAIGESSTPVADLVLGDLTDRYDLPRLAPLAKYGTWQAAYPHLGCGLKRGFSYFQHRPGHAFKPCPNHTNELLVAASSGDLHSDTHWLRAEVDAFLADEAQTAGVPLFDRTELTSWNTERDWTLTGRRADERVRIRARFLIDASGEAAVVPRALGIANGPGDLKTHSRALFGHFAGLRPWPAMLAARGAVLDDHPFRCDDAALHHVLDGGWMWQLRFNNGVTSAGFALDCRRFPHDPSLSPEDEWQEWLDHYPSLAEQFDGAECIAPPGGLRRTGRLQRRTAQAAGTNWLLLPNTAGFIDPLHSTGIAHTLCGIERLARVFERDWQTSLFAARLQEYAGTVHTELELIDQLVAGCYSAFIDFRLTAAYSMLYFAAATTYERRRLDNKGPFTGAFLCADDREFRHIVDAFWRRLARLAPQGGMPDDGISEAAVQQFETELAKAVMPFNTVGLCDPSVKNMYRYTAVPIA